jgi:Ser/Thr protein kinase RdoA (MazF antagonist)
MSIVNFAPAFSSYDAMRLADELYALSGTVTQLPSERDQNFLIVGKSGKRYVLKIANSSEKFAMLDAQNQVMEHASSLDGLLPYVL